MSSTMVDAVIDFTGRDVAAMTGHEAVDRLGELNTAIALLSADRLTTVQAIQESGVWSSDGSRSAAAWLSRVERSSKAAAGSDLKLARMLAGHLPADMLRRCAAVTCRSSMPGRSPGPAYGPRRCARCSPTPTVVRGSCSTTPGWVLEDFKRFLNAWCYRVDPDAADQGYREASEGFTFTLAQTTEGAIPGGFLSPLAAEALKVALLAEIGVPALGDTRTHPQRMHDALASIAARALDGGGLGRHATVRPQVVVHVPLATLEANAGTRGLSTGRGEARRSRGGPGGRPSAARPDGRPAGPPPTGAADSEVLDVGRTQRTFTGPRRRALDARDGGCRWPGCHAPPAQSEGHHQTRWTDGGRTDPREGLLLCWYHHTYTHAHGVTITGNPAGTLTFTDRHGNPIGTSWPRTGPGGRADPLPWADPLALGATPSR